MQRKNGKTLIIVLTLMAVLFFAACTGTPATISPSPVMEITDQAARTITLAATPQRIVSLAPSNTEILFALGLGEKVAAVTDYCDYPPEAADKPSIGGFSTPNIEAIIALSPDLVVAASLHESKIVPQLEGKGVKVLVLKPQTLDEVMAAITLTGKACGVEDNAGKLVRAMEQRIAAVTEKTADLAPGLRPSACYIVWHDPLMLAGTETLQDELIEKAGGINIARMLGTPPGYGALSLESFLAADPQVIIAGTGHGSDGEQTFRYLLDEPRLGDTAARKNGRVHAVDADPATRPGPRIVDALEQFARCIHPDLFE